MTVPRDSGHDFIDQNGHRMNRRFTLLPLIEAVQTVTARKKVAPKFDWSSVDFVTDRTGLRKLVAWANSKSDDWRIDTQLAGDKTILINAWSSVTKQSSGQSESYGFNFEKACTHPAPGCESGTGHHRIVTYVRALYSSGRTGPDRRQDFGGLRMVVRFEVDACLPLRSASSHRKPSRSTRPIKPVTSTLTCEDNTHPFQPNNKPTLHFPRLAVIRAGFLVPQSHLIELKTYSRSGKAWSNSYPQLFLSQTPHIYYGAHRNGKFSEIKKYTLGEPHLEVIDQDAQVGFKKLKLALTTIQELVRKYGTDGRISLVCSGKELGVYQREDAGSCLPKHALALFGA